MDRATPIHNLVEYLRRDLDYDHVISNHRNVVFLCHSMGGLIVRALLLEYKDKGYADKTRMVYFFGTPTEGSELAKLAKLFSRNRQVRDLMPFADDDYLESLQNQWLASDYPSTW